MPAAARNRREAATVDWLIDRLAVRLGDRDGGRHAPPWEPKQEVLLGVLEPERVTAPPVTDSDTPGEGDPTAQPDTPAAPAETATRPSGEIPSIGLDFRLRTPPGATSVGLDLDVAFAVYLEELATLEEQRSYLGATLEPPTETAPAEATAAGETTPEAPSPTAPAPDGQKAAEAPEAAPQPAPAGRKRKERKARVLGAWRRRDVELGTQHIDLPLDGQVVTVDTPLVRPVAEIIDAHYARADAMRPFVGKRNELAPAFLADSTVFAAAIAEALDGDWKPRYPDLELTAFAQRLADDEYLVSVALRNTTTIEGRAQQDLSIYDCQLSVHPGDGAQVVPQRFDLAPDDYRMTELADVIGRGTSCVAVATDHGGLRS